MTKKLTIKLLKAELEEKKNLLIFIHGKACVMRINGIYAANLSIADDC